MVRSNEMNQPPDKPTAPVNLINVFLWPAPAFAIGGLLSVAAFAAAYAFVGKPNEIAGWTCVAIAVAGVPAAAGFVVGTILGSADKSRRSA
jgi:hypothetical protein